MKRSTSIRSKSFPESDITANLFKLSKFLRSLIFDPGTLTWRSDFKFDSGEKSSMLVNPTSKVESIFNPESASIFEMAH